MRRAWMAYSLLFGSLVLSHSPVFAQGDPNSTPPLTPAELEAKQTLEAQQRSQKAFSDFLRTSKIQPGTPNNASSLFLQFRMAIPKFRASTADYGWVLSMQGKLDKSLKEIGTQTDVMLKYLSEEKVHHPKPDPLEFKDYSPTELQWETLNSAERISAYLDFAVLAERQETVTAKTLQFLYTLDGELLRLKWLTAHVK